MRYALYGGLGYLIVDKELMRETPWYDTIQEALANCNPMTDKHENDVMSSMRHLILEFDSLDDFPNQYPEYII